MKNLKYFLLMAVPVVLLSCGQSTTQNRENNDDGGMGTRDRDYENVQRNDADRSGMQGVQQQDTAKYRSGSGTSGSGMGTHSDTSMMHRSGSQGSGSMGTPGRSGTQGSSSTRQGTPSGSSASQGSRSGQGSTMDTSGTRGTQGSSSTRSNTNKSTNQDNTQVNPR